MSDRHGYDSGDYLVEELEGNATEVVPVARSLERYTRSASPEAPRNLASRVMAAVSREPVPTPPARFLGALGALSLSGMVTSFGAVPRTALGFGRSFPIAVRAQAMVLLIVSLGRATPRRPVARRPCRPRS